MGTSKTRATDLFQYVLIIKKEKPVNIDYISIFLCLISFLFFLFFSYTTKSFATIFFWGSLLIPAALFRTLWMKRKHNRGVTFKHPLLLTGFIWLWVPGLRWVFIFFIFFVLFDHQSRQPLEIGISDEQIVINTFFRKRYQWNELSNVVLKDGLFTMDFRNNKLLQRETAPGRERIDEAAFNEFCREQLDINNNTGDLPKGVQQ